MYLLLSSSRVPRSMDPLFANCLPMYDPLFRISCWSWPNIKVVWGACFRKATGCCMRVNFLRMRKGRPRSRWDSWTTAGKMSGSGLWIGKEGIDWLKPVCVQWNMQFQLGICILWATCLNIPACLIKTAFPVRLPNVGHHYEAQWDSYNIATDITFKIKGLIHANYTVL